VDSSDQIKDELGQIVCFESAISRLLMCEAEARVGRIIAFTHSQKRYQAGLLIVLYQSESFRNSTVDPLRPEFEIQSCNRSKMKILNSMKAFKV
jgi:hypothetical protein